MGAKLTCKFDLYDDELFDGGDNKHQKYLSYIYDNCIKGAEYIDKSEENDENEENEENKDGEEKVDPDWIKFEVTKEFFMNNQEIMKLLEKRGVQYPDNPAGMLGLFGFVM